MRNTPTRVGDMFMRMITFVLAGLVCVAPAFSQSSRDMSPVDYEADLKSELPPTFPMDEGTRGDDQEVGYRIVGGHAARPGQWPSMIAIFRRSFANGKSSVCGGSI